MLKARDSFIQHMLCDTPSLGALEYEDDYEPWDHGVPNLLTNSFVDGFYGS